MSTYTLTPSRPGSNIYYFKAAGVPVSIFEFLQGAASATFLKNYIQCINRLGLEEFYWEHPAITADALDSPYRVAIVSAPNLKAIGYNPKPFSTYFTEADAIATFFNRRKDALLLAPRPKTVPGGLRDYATLARFLRHADEPTAVNFLKKVFATWHTQLTQGSDYIYLSTHGLGVHWLHVRLDQRPKYYHTKIFSY